MGSDNIIFFSDSNLYFDFINSLYSLDKIEETGLSIQSEIKISEDTSTTIDKMVKIGGLEDTHETYLKVVEMRDLTKEEIKLADKAREFLSKLFEIFFRGEKVNVILSVILILATGIEIFSGNFIGTYVRAASFFLINRPIAFTKEMYRIIKKDIKTIKRNIELKKIEEYLRQRNVLEYIDIAERYDVEMYAKIKK